MARFCSCLWLIFHCMHVPHLLYPFLCWWTFQCFHVLAIVNTAAVDIRVHVRFWIMVFWLWVYDQEWDCWIICSSVFSVLRSLQTEWSLEIRSLETYAALGSTWHHSREETRGKYPSLSLLYFSPDSVSQSQSQSEQRVRQPEWWG